MTDLLSIYFVAIFFYLFESVRRTGLQAVLFRPRARFPVVYPSNGDWGWTVLSLLRPWRPVLIVDPPEIRVSGAGVLVGRMDDARQIEAISWQKLPSLEAEDGELVLGRRKVACSDAAFWKTRLEGLRKSEADRQGALDRLLAHSFDAGAVRRRVAELRAVSGRLPLCVGSLFVSLFVVYPALIILLPPAGAVIALGCLLFAHSAAIAVQFAGAHERLYGRAARGTAWKLGLYPIAALRAMDDLARELLTPFHALAAAAAIGDRRDCERVGRVALREALFPVNADVDNADAAGMLAAYSAAQLRLIRGLLAELNLAEGKLMPTPDRQDPSIVSYCPRCLSQYQSAAKVCPDCPSIAVVPFGRKEAIRA